jgi:hypothetical protein
MNSLYILTVLNGSLLAERRKCEAHFTAIDKSTHFPVQMYKRTAESKETLNVQQIAGC